VKIEPNYNYQWGTLMRDTQKVILVSGGSRGLGKAFIEDLLSAGHKVYTFSRTMTPFIESVKSGEHADRFFWEGVDGTDFEKVEEFVKRMFEREKRIDVLVNNAGMAVDGVLTLMDPVDISSVLALNLEGVIRITRVAAKYMLLARSGVVVNISSIIGIRGYSGLAVYSATKAGLDGFSRAMARELGGRGVRVNSLAPGYLETDMSEKLDGKQRDQIIRRTPLGRLGTVHDVTGVLRFLISDEARFVTGQTIVVDGGITS
jgi:3-oxoacyl-[acyl-carrier protein] reductase